MGGVVQGEVQAVDLRARVEAVETALLPGEFIHDDDVPELARGPCAHLDGLAHTHLAQLDQPRPVPVAGEPGVRVPVEVAFQLLAPLVQRRGRHQALNAGGGVLADEEGGSLEPVKEPWPPAGRRLVQRPDDALTVGLVLGQVQAGEVQPPYRGRTISEDLGHHVRLGEVQRVQERPGPGEPAMARRTVGRLVPPAPGRYTAGWPERVERRDLTAVLEPDDRPGPGRAGLFAGDPAACHNAVTGRGTRRSA